MSWKLQPHPKFPGVKGPVVVCVMDGVGIGREDDSDAVWLARTPLSAFKNLRTGGMRATNVEDGDTLLAVRAVTDDDAHVMLFTRNGQVIRFPLDAVSQYGRTARGTFGIRLALPNPDLAIPGGQKCRLEFADKRPQEAEDVAAAHR